MVSTTTSGIAAGLVVGSNLPSPSSTTDGVYVVVDSAGTPSAPAPVVSLSPPDYILGVTNSAGSSWNEIDLSQTVAGQVASNIVFTPYGQLSSTNVQDALQELETEKMGLAGGTCTGQLLISNTGSIVFEGATVDAYELTLAVADPQSSDKTITFPDITGTLITTADTNTVTSTMVNGSLVNANLAANAAIAFSKLAALTSAQILVGNGSNVATAVAVTGDISINNAGLTAIAAGVIVNADISGSAAITGSKVTTGTTSAVGVLQLTNSAASTSTTTAATPAAVKTAKDAADAAATTANAALPKAGGTMTDNLLVDNDKEVRFFEADSNGSTYVGIKGATDKGSEGSYTISLPAASPTAGQILKANASTPTTLEWGTDSATDATKMPLAGGTFTGDVQFNGDSSNGLWDKSASAFVANLTGNVTGNVSGTSGGFTAGNASNLNSGTVNVARLGSGSSVTTKFLRGDNTWQTISSTPEGTAILSTGESGGTKFLREDGDGSCSWQTVTGTTINNNANNRIISGSGTANTLEGEANLTFDGATLTIDGNGGGGQKIALTGISEPRINYYENTTLKAHLIWQATNGEFNIQNVEHQNILSVGSTLRWSINNGGSFTTILDQSNLPGNVGSGGLLASTNVYVNEIHGNGSNLTALNASNLGSGTVATARLGSGTASSSTFLRGDGSWQAVTSTTINNNANNRIITGSGTANTLEAEANLTFDGTNLDLPDSKKIRLGTGNDFELFHNGSHTYFAQTGDGNIFFKCSDVTFQSDDGSVTALAIDANGGITLKHANTTRIETSSSGATISGTCVATTFSGSGASLTSLNASNISSGTIAAARVATLNQNTTGTSGGFTAGSASNLNSGTLPDARFPSTLPAVSGANLTNLPATGGTFTGTASGSLTAGQVVFLNSSGQLKKPSNTITANNPVDVGTFVGMYITRTTFQPRAAWDTVNKIGVNWCPSSAYNSGSSASFYLTPFTLDESSTPALMVMGSQTSASSAYASSSTFQCICVGQPTSTTSRFLAVWKQTNNYSVAQCFDTNGSNSLQFVGSQVQVGHLGYGYRVYSDPQGICKTGTAGQYLWQGYNASAARGGVELLTVDASGNVTRGNSLETDAAHGQQSDKGSSCFYDPNADRVIAWWQDESSPHYHNWTNFRVNGASLTKNSSSNIGAYCTSTVCSFDDTLNKFCMVICDQTNNRQAVLIGNATSSGLSYTTTQIFNSNNWSSEASGTIDANSGRVIVSYAQSGNTSPLNIQSAPLSGNSPGTWTTAANLPSYLMSKYHWHGPMLNIPHLSELMFFVHQYNSAYQYRRAMEYGLKVAVVTTDLTADNFLGIAQSSGSGTKTVDVISAINTQVSGLTVGAKYYAQGDGTIATSPDGLAGSIPVGMALASNKLLIKH